MARTPVIGRDSPVNVNTSQILIESADHTLEGHTSRPKSLDEFVKMRRGRRMNVVGEHNGVRAPAELSECTLDPPDRLIPRVPIERVDVPEDRAVSERLGDAIHGRIRR